MCYDDEAKPPLPPGQTGAYHAEDIVLASADGNQFSAYLAVPEQSQQPTVQVIIYPDVRGLHEFYKELARRFAEIGVTALALDYFGRTAGMSSRAEGFEFMPHVDQMTLNSFSADVHAALDYLRMQYDPQRPTFVIGFCMGGTLALLTATNPDFKFAGVIPFYAGFKRDFGGSGTALDNAERIIYPVLGLFGGADPGIPENLVRELDDRLDKAGVSHHIEIYAGAPHSFFDRRAAVFADASADAWRRVMAFIKGEKQPESEIMA
ncbi:MAG: dienelactone hydrolase family protein [Anaerolineae bacterium]